jgi:hypothetical protein
VFGERPGYPVCLKKYCEHCGLAKRGNEEQGEGPSSQKAIGPNNKDNQNVSNADVNLEVHKEQVNVVGLDATPMNWSPRKIGNNNGE